MKIGIIGTGISGMLVAYLLHQEHELTVFEANDYIGGHTHTLPIKINGVTYPVDTGFIVFNDWTYPNFQQLLAHLEVSSQPSTMSFSVRCEGTGLEYNGTSLNALFAQRRNLLRPSFYRMLRDILRFNREAPHLLAQPGASLSLGCYLDQNQYSQQFVEHYIIPMGAAIWSTDPRQMFDFPARYFIQFFHNHGMLSVNERPQWHVVQGGSQAYVQALTAPYHDCIRLNCPVQRVQREADYVAIQSGQPGNSATEHFDAVVFATHSDQALHLLADASDTERAVLGDLPYQENEVVLHTDVNLLPKKRLAWASWNYHLMKDARNRVALTYHMNTLQSLDAPVEFCVTLNRTMDIDPRTILQRMTYHHPVYTTAGVAAQTKHEQLNGQNRTYFCGAYWGYGFHEDGVKSALAVSQHFGKGLAGLT